MTKDVISQFRLWRKTLHGLKQIRGRHDVYRPANAPLQMPKAPFTQKQRQAIIDWYWGNDPDHRQKSKNSMAAVSAQLKVSKQF